MNSRNVFAMCLLMVLCAWDWPRSKDRKVEKANQLVAQLEFEDADEAYQRASLKEGNEFFKIHFNRGVLFAKKAMTTESKKERNKLLQQASTYFSKASNSKDSALRSECLYNLGNAFLLQGFVEDSISAYRDSLLIDSKNENTVFNLNIALRMLKEDQQERASAGAGNESPNKDKSGTDTTPDEGPQERKAATPSKGKGNMSSDKNTSDALKEAIRRMERLENRSKNLQRKKIRQRAELVGSKETHVTW